MLVSTLNEMLIALSIPFTLTSPKDLTPPLLLAILESLISSRLPIAPAIRESCDPSSKVQAMKIFLGVLETDVLKRDVGLGHMDPRRLARGEWEEVVFVGKLLVWLAKKMKIIGHQVASEHERDDTISPSNRSTSASIVHTDLSMITDGANDSDTSVASTSTAITERGPRCIHEIDEPSFISLHPSESSGSHDPHTSTDLVQSSDEESYCDCPPSPPIPHHTPIRYSGLISQVDNELEISSFEESRRQQEQTPLSKHSRPSHIVTKHTSPTRHRLQLLNERADLLSELASLKTQRKIPNI